VGRVVHPPVVVSDLFTAVADAVPVEIDAVPAGLEGAGHHAVDPAEGVAVRVEEGRMKHIDPRIEIGDPETLARERMAERIIVPHTALASISSALTLSIG